MKVMTNTPPQALENWTGLEVLERDALIIANARRLIKANKRTSNQGLYMDLFGTGFGTARTRCIKLGCDPESNITDYTAMIESIRGRYRVEVKGEKN